MTTTTNSDHAANGRAKQLPRSWSDRGGKLSAPRLTTAARRRKVPYLLLGVLLVLACTAAGVVVGTTVGDREQVLVLAGPVTVGHVLSSQDILQSSLAKGNDLGAIPADELPTVVGQPIAFSLPTGALLTRAVLGTPRVPPQGQAVVAVAVKPGQFPPDLSQGTRVAVIVIPGTNATGGTAPSAPLSWSATVTDVQSKPNDQNTVVALLLNEADARGLASVPAGQITLLAVNGGER
ncbi:hypothetical protein [Actinokineospora sp. NBRC 105648]|uniref:hypothetical protein n=1 Tax=Actinokineospora sp. NBRC 105648 TaxID=3032206 RepID=UPI0024A4D877|nr:hypothetical protein [Actinokineospora sp. NBRC 105648]GLZ37883.1 hypothetical protein Acsp05_15070 [Actinokineospora sp. NBRC 105648]